MKIYYKKKEITLEMLIHQVQTKFSLPLLVNFFEQILKLHPSVSDRPELPAPRVTLEIMKKIHSEYNKAKKEDCYLATISDKEKAFKSKIYGGGLPCYNDLHQYVILLKTVITPSNHIFIKSKRDIRPFFADNSKVNTEFSTHTRSYSL